MPVAVNIYRESATLEDGVVVANEIYTDSSYSFESDIEVVETNQVINPFRNLIHGKKKRKNLYNFSRGIQEKVQEYLSGYKFMQKRIKNLSGKLILNLSKFDLIPKDKIISKLSLGLRDSDNDIQKTIEEKYGAIQLMTTDERALNNYFSTGDCSLLKVNRNNNELTEIGNF